ncbi:hypothetical protein ES703_00497 [subsurface metagenome]
MKPPQKGFKSELYLRGVQTTELPGNKLRAILNTSRGDIECLFHPCPGETGGVIWVCGALGGLDGPSFGIFSSLSDELASEGVSSLRLHYRIPGNLDECILDVLVGVHFLKGRKIDRIALVGHSFGAAVVITAGTLSPEVKAVVGVSSQTAGAQLVDRLAPKPLLLIHGQRDRNLPVRCSHQIYEWAKEPKELVIYEGSGHFLRECHQELHDLLKGWLVDKVGQE